MIKNPTVDTSFLPDKDREVSVVVCPLLAVTCAVRSLLQEAEQKEREHLRQEWLEKQEKIKSECVCVCVCLCVCVCAAL